MHRRDFLHASAAIGITGGLTSSGPAADTPGYASPREAMKGPREKYLFVTCTYANTGVDKPDYLAVVDADPASETYSAVVHRLPMPQTGDELHHFGWNICAACHGKPGDRRYLIVPGLKSGRIHVVDAKDPLHLKLHKVIEPETVAKAVGLSAPHTVHCLPDESVMISMLGNAKGDAPGGFLLLDKNFDIAGRWEKDGSGLKFNYDFWYQPRKSVMVSTEWAAPNTYLKGFDPKDVEAGKYGTKLNIWQWDKKVVLKTLDLGEKGRIPLEVRFCHDPESSAAFVAAALGGVVFLVSDRKEKDETWEARPVITVDPGKADGKPVPGLITDILLSMDDRFLYLSNWLHGDVRQYDISDPAKPKLAGQLFLGGVIGKGRERKGKKLGGGPQMLQLSLDGKRLYVTNSLLSVWDNQFYPDLAKQGSWMVRIDCDTDKGGLRMAERFFVDFGKEPGGPSRAHEVRYPGGDCTSDIFA